MSAGCDALCLFCPSHAAHIAVGTTTFSAGAIVRSIRVNNGTRPPTLAGLFQGKQFLGFNGQPVCGRSFILVHFCGDQRATAIVNTGPTKSSGT